MMDCTDINLLVPNEVLDENKNAEEGSIRNPAFISWDFHANEAPQTSYNFSSYLDNIKMTMESFMKKKVKDF
jgi:hypothetical protein